MQYPPSVMDKLLSLQETGKRLVDAGELYEAFQSIFGCQSGITAGATAYGTLLTQAINEVVSGTFIQLPSAIMGLRVTVVNNSTGTLYVSAQPMNPANGGQPDMIDGAIAVGQAADEASVYICYSLGNWTQVGGTAVLP